jgi:hypothetical protein
VGHESPFYCKRRALSRCESRLEEGGGNPGTKRLLFSVRWRSKKYTRGVAETEKTAIQKCPPKKASSVTRQTRQSFFKGGVVGSVWGGLTKRGKGASFSRAF